MGLKLSVTIITLLTSCKLNNNHDYNISTLISFNAP